MSPAGAFAYLTFATVRNRLLSRARRLRDPRYALALVVGSLYFWFFLIRPGPHLTGGEAAPELLGAGAEVLALLGVAALVASPWLVKDQAASLTFSPAEVSVLFPAPVTRRALVAYKLWRSQLVVCVNALLWVFVLRRSGSPLPGALRFVAVWVLFTNLSLHRTGASLVRTSWLEHGRAGLRRLRLPLAILVAALATLATALALDAPRFSGAHGAGALLDALAHTLSTPPASVVLWPLRLAVAPTFARTTAEWARTLWPALALAALQAVWVLRTDSAFEEASARASTERARRLEARRTRGVAPGVRASGARRRSPPLAPTGHPAVAIVWKNAIALLRTGQPMGLVAMLVVGIAVALLAADDRAGTGIDAHFVSVAAVTTAVVLLLAGSRVIRCDLRLDMLHLATLKTLPLAGASLVAAEVTSSTLPLVAAELVLVAVGYVASLADPTAWLALGTRTALLVASPLALGSVTAATLVVHNGAALLFPAWVRLGPQAGGVEAMGQGLLSLSASLVLLAVALLPTAPVFWLTERALGAMLPESVALAAALAVASVVLLGELGLLVRRLGRALERREPADV